MVCVPIHLVAALTVLVAGCAGGLPTTHYHVLRPPTEAVGGGAGGDGLAIGVETFAVDPPYDQDRLVYRRGTESSEVGFYAYQRWASPPGALVAVAVEDEFRGTPGVRSIEPAASAGDYSARLGGRVLYLEGIDLERGSEGRVAIAFVLRDLQDETVWSGKFSAVAVGEAEHGGDVVALVRRALDDVLEQARASLEAVLAD